MWWIFGTLIILAITAVALADNYEVHVADDWQSGFKTFTDKDEAIAHAKKLSEYWQYVRVTNKKTNEIVLDLMRGKYASEVQDETA